MLFYVSSYNDKREIYICSINNKGKMAIKFFKEMLGYPSYISKYKNDIAIALKSDEECCSGIIVLDKRFAYKAKFLDEDSYTHVYVDSKHILGGSYHDGNILIIDKRTKKTFKQKIKNAKIHQVGKLYSNDYYAIDMENRKIYIFKIGKTNLKKISEIDIINNKPRHLKKSRKKYLRVL